VAKALDIANSRDMVSRLDTDQRGAVGLTDTIGRSQSLTVISESGFYDVVVRSDKPQGQPSVIDMIRVLGGKKNPKDVWMRIKGAYPEVVGKCDHFIPVLSLKTLTRT
jgi:hypothetical protein